MRPKIDIVYTWVNDSDSEFIQQLQQYVRSEKDFSHNRFRDIHHTLKYSIRSIEMFAPWINKIHIVTQRPQCPAWLKTVHPKIQIVHHDEFIPQAYLPTYNPRVIQSFFHLLPDSSDYLIYFNDDYLLANLTEAEDFVSTDNKLKVYGSIMGIPLKFRVYAQKNQIKGLPYLEHSPFIIYKPYWEAMLKLRPEELESTRNSRFRDASNLRVDRLYRYYLLSKQRKNIKVVSAYKLLKISHFYRVGDNPNALKEAIVKIKNKRPKFLCLNDNQSNVPNEDVKTLLTKFLNEMYPNPCSFEK